MEVKKAFETLKRAKNDLSIVASDEYVKAKLSFSGLGSVAYQIGPKCNLECIHCYGGYGPKRERVPGPELTERVLSQSIDLGMNHLVLTDGEPLMDENRSNMNLIARSSRELPVQIITNAKFADTLGFARDWIGFLRDSGFDLRARGNMLRVSSGATYPISPRNYANLVQAASEIFGRKAFNYHLTFYHLGIGDAKRNKKSLVALLRTIDSVLGKGVESDLAVEGSGERYKYYPVKGEKGYVPICLFDCLPEGRARGIPSVVERYPRVRIRIDDIPFNPCESRSICVDSLGNTGFGLAQSSAFGKGNYGNILSLTLLEIMGRMFRDPIFQADRLGGLRFVYHLAQKTRPGYEVYYFDLHDFSRALFADEELTQEMQDRIKSNGLIKEYRNYIKEAGVPKRI